MNSRSIRIALDLMTLLDNQCEYTGGDCKCCELYEVSKDLQRPCDMIVQTAREILRHTVNE